MTPIRLPITKRVITAPSREADCDTIPAFLAFAAHLTSRSVLQHTRRSGADRSKAQEKGINDEWKHRTIPRLWMHRLFGIGTPRALQGAALALSAAISLLWAVTSEAVAPIWNRSSCPTPARGCVITADASV